MGVWHLKSGQLVFDRQPSHIHEGVTEAMLSATLAAIAVAEGEQRVRREFTYPHIIGVSRCVATNDADEIVYARRVHRFGYTRFVINRELEPCNKLSVVLWRGENGCYELSTAYVGPLTPPEPFTEEADEEARVFWSRHALCWGSEPVEEDTVTRECLWPSA